MTISIPQFHSPDSQFEEFAQLCTERIGIGTSREVFEIPDHSDKVLKVMRIASNYSNWAEMVVYQSLGVDQRFLARIHSISWSGKFLVMERLSQAAWDEILPVIHTFPRIINDRKPSNFGKDSAGNIKMLDYALVELGPPPEIHPPAILSSD